MIKYGNWVWEGTSLETKPGEPEAHDGHIFKELDTGESYTRINGQWQFINLGLSFIKATKSGKIATNAGGVAQIAFTTPFIDDQYTVALSCELPSGINSHVAYFSNITTTGFKISTKDAKTGLPAKNVMVSYLCTRNYDP